jgi:hypothetical protein
MRAGTKAVLALLLGWFCLALGFGVTGRFEDVGAVGVAVTVWSLTILVLAVCGFVPLVRHWLARIPPVWLIALHLTRVVGFYFLLLSQQGLLPAGFAKPAGIGDAVVATLALLILAAPFLRQSRPILLTWNTLGLIDILLVVTGALRFGLRDLQSMRALRVLPLSLLPTFLVPLIIATHVLLFVRLSGGGTLLKSRIENPKSNNGR